MQQVIIVIHLMLVLALIGVVLLQRSEGGGLGIGSTGGFMTSRGTANVLTRATAILAALFFATSLILSILAGYNRKPTSILGGSRTPAQSDAGRAAAAGRAGRGRPAQTIAAGRARRRRRRARWRRRAARRCRSRSDLNEGPGNRPFGVREEDEDGDGTLCRREDFSSYAQAQTGSALFALVESIREG